MKFLFLRFFDIINRGWSLSYLPAYLTTKHKSVYRFLSRLKAFDAPSNDIRYKSVQISCHLMNRKSLLFLCIYI
jgi:hypothetical protein